MQRGIFSPTRGRVSLGRWFIGLLLFGLLVTLLLLVQADADRLRQTRLVEVAVPLLFLTINACVCLEWSLGPGTLTRWRDSQP